MHLSFIPLSAQEVLMRISTALAVTLAALFLISCAQQQPDLAALRKTVDAYNAASRESMLTGNSDKLMSYYEDDALEMAPNMAVMKGKDAIRAFQNSMSKMGMKFNAVTFETSDLQAGGKVAYEIGSYDMTITMAPMGEMKDNGKYIALWRQQADGAWKVHAEMWSSNQPPPPMPDMTAKSGKRK
jgi:ketosteroid isomerase-like protein